MKNAAEISYYRPPTATELRRIERIWRTTHEGQRRNIPKALIERLAAYFDGALFNAQIRVDCLSSTDLPQQQATQEKKELLKELRLCREIGSYLIRLQLSAQRPT